MTVAALRPDDVLDREADVDEVAVGRDVQPLEVRQQRRPLVPRHRLGAEDDVVALERRQRDERHVAHPEPGRELAELVPDLLERRLVVVDEVHLVDAHDDVRDAQQRREERVAPALLGDALAGVEQDQRDVGRRGPGHHVPGVLDVPGGVRDDELAARGREVAVRDVDRDALLALGAQAVGQERQVREVVAAVQRHALHGLELVAEQRLAVVQEAADEGALAVVDGPGGREPEEVHRHQK